MEKFLTYNNKILKLGTKILFEDIGVKATGGIITYDGDYTIHTFTGGTDYFIVESGGDIEYLIVAGGGGGGGGFYSYAGVSAGGGGGAGGLLTGTKTITNDTYTINVGSGGTGGLNYHWDFKSPEPYYSGEFADDGVSGENSSAFNLIAIGGGGGARGHYNRDYSGQIYYGLSGGSGGGSTNGTSNPAISGGTPVAGQGYAGGGSYGSGRGWGGGGGASQSGETGGVHQNGSGGTGYEFYSVYYAGGGGSGGFSMFYGGSAGGGIGGIGGGGDGGNNSVGENGTTNTGGGGGGGGCKYSSAECFSGGTGGSGIIIIRYLT